MIRNMCFSIQFSVLILRYLLDQHSIHKILGEGTYKKRDMSVHFNYNDDYCQKSTAYMV